MNPPPQRLVLVTRPAEAGGETAARVSQLGYIPILAPLLRIQPLATVLPPPAALQGVLVTSPRALPALTAAYHEVPLLAVGDATAAQARQAGHTSVESAAGNAEDLQRLVQARCDPAAGTLLLLSGRGEGAALAAGLRRRFSVAHHVAYAAMPADQLPAAAVAALRNAPAGAGGELVAALFFSAATARTFVALAEAAGLRDTVTRVCAVAISAETAAALAALPWRMVRVARRPNQDALLDLLR